MALHELATNAGKYGALFARNREHRNRMAALPGRGSGRLFELIWTEHGGPESRPRPGPASVPTVIETIPRMELDAEIRLDYVPEGLRWRLVAPLRAFWNHSTTATGPACRNNERQAMESTNPQVVEDNALLALELGQAIKRRASPRCAGPALSAAQAIATDRKERLRRCRPRYQLAR